jgi:predicted nucleic acid-binding protein
VIHLDTSFLVDLLREAARPAPGPASRFLDSHADEELGVSVMVVCELSAGAELAARPSVERGRVRRLCDSLRIAYPDARFAPTYARLLSAQARAGRPIATMDLLIATSAIVDEAPLVTRNTRDFQRVPGLEVLGY